MEQFITLTDEEIEDLANGKDVMIQVGKRIFRTLTIKSEYQIKKERLDKAYKTKLEKLEKELK